MHSLHLYSSGKNLISPFDQLCRKMDSDNEVEVENVTMGRRSNVTQFPPEYDDFNMESGSFSNQRVFSHDINRRMKVPDRLSVDGQNLHEMEIENLRANASSTQYMASASMNVPDKITVVGSGTREPFEDTSNVFNGGFTKVNYVNVTTPPRVLTVDERFPAVDEDENDEMLQVEKTMHSVGTPSKHMELHHPDSFDVVGHNTPSYKIKMLERRIHQLEILEQQRRTREMIMYVLIASYSIFKVAKWYLSH